MCLLSMTDTPVTSMAQVTGSSVDEEVGEQLMTHHDTITGQEVM